MMDHYHIAQEADVKELERVVAALGNPGFNEALLASLVSAARVDHYALIRFDGARTARLVATASRAGLHVERGVQEEYLDHFQRLDPNRRLFGRTAPGQPLLNRLPRERVPNAHYRLRCYDRPGLVDRISVIAEAEGDWYCLNLFRAEQSGRFGGGETAAIRDSAGLLAALAIKHDRIARPGAILPREARRAGIDARLRQLDARLTGREREVLVRVVSGMTSEGIALDLGIGVNSVLTYRKRAYARLRIGSQNELFSLCLYGCHKPM